jgi:hypothetical protein
MADKPPLTQYLIKLATDPAESQSFKNCDPARREKLMKEAGLNAPQRSAVQSGDAKQIVEQVMVELEECASTPAQYKGNTISIILPMGHFHIHHLQVAAEDE